MQAMEEILSTQKALDEKAVMDETGKIHKTARAESMRVQGGHDLQRLLGLPSLDPTSIAALRQFGPVCQLRVGQPCKF